MVLFSVLVEDAPGATLRHAFHFGEGVEGGEVAVVGHVGEISGCAVVSVAGNGVDGCRL